ncbi:MAG: OB-fold domain-containing protein [Ilumatobacteraceae bacterium]|jgi:uncharacterized OB-fold protein|nr:OB-fold domain-containing protein [Ilumatobacteraceae bacterium]
MAGDKLQVTFEADGSLSAPLTLFYPYNRTLGTTVARFLSSLADKRIEGTKAQDGRVFVPPAEFDPSTGTPLTEWVQVGDEGTVVQWSWQPAPFEDNTLDQPFAWALILLDGADVPMLHAVQAKAAATMSIGMRVKAVWAEDRTPEISAIRCFEPVGG